jgi:hypothetical protein
LNGVPFESRRNDDNAIFFQSADRFLNARVINARITYEGHAIPAEPEVRFSSLGLKKPEQNVVRPSIGISIELLYDVVALWGWLAKTPVSPDALTKRADVI